MEPQSLINWGGTIGPAVAVCVTRLLAENKHPEHGYRVPRPAPAGQALRQVRLEAACALALQIDACQYRHVNDILANNRDRMARSDSDESISPDHAHVRGPRYYQ